MTRVISRKDLYKRDFGKAEAKTSTDDIKPSMKGFAEVMYFLYKLENNRILENNQLTEEEET